MHEKCKAVIGIIKTKYQLKEHNKLQLEASLYEHIISFSVYKLTDKKQQIL